MVPGLSTPVCFLCYSAGRWLRGWPSLLTNKAKPQQMPFSSIPCPSLFPTPHSSPPPPHPTHATSPSSQVSLTLETPLWLSDASLAF